MLFPGIEFALNHGLRVCVATPRTDVVLELLPRLKKHLRKSKSLLCTAAAKTKPDSADDFNRSPADALPRHFDVMIIDEVDVFPFSADETLRFAVDKARKKNSALVYVTATPSDTLKRRLKPVC